MDGTQSEPKFFERLISRLADESDSAEGVLTLLRRAHEQGVSDVDTLTRLEGTLGFAEPEVRDAIVTRSRTNVLKENNSIERITAYIIKTAYSRFPVTNEGRDEVLSILYAKDLLRYMFDPEQFHLRSVLRPAVFVPKGRSLTSPLKEFREQCNRMTIVTNEYGGTSGLVTFEDIIEQVVGDIEDGSDGNGGADNVRAVSSGRWHIHTTTKIKGISTFFSTGYSSEEADTIDGLVVQELGHLPVRDEKVIIGNL